MRWKLITLLLFASTFCRATNYFVSSSTGNEKNSGRAASRSKKSIQQAADLSKPGDTIFVMNGIYTNSCPTCNVVNIPVSGTESRYIVYMNYKNHRPKISFNGWAGFAIRNGVSYVKISGFEIAGNNANVVLSKALKQPKSCNNKSGDYDPRFNGNGVVIDGRGKKNNPHHILISNNKIHDCGGGGVSAIHTDYITVENNLIYNNSWYTVFGASGISFYQFENLDDKKGYHNVIRRNKCFNNKSMVPWFKTCRLEDGNGIIIDDFMNKQNGSTNGIYRGMTLIENNICWNNGGTGIHTFQSSYVDIINNTSYHNSKSDKVNAGEILAGSSTDIRILNNILVTDKRNRINSNYENERIIYENNLHYNSSTPGIMLISLTSSTCISGKEPHFKKPDATLNADFSILKNSPALNAGNIQIFSLTDFTGRPRSHNKPDIGAYEFFE